MIIIMCKIKAIIISIAILSCLVLISCAKEQSGTVTQDSETIPEDHILGFSGKIDARESIEEIYNYADYVVIAEVTSVGESFIITGEELDTTLPENEIMYMLNGLRTPYEATVISSYKGDLEVGESYTVLGFNGSLNGYATESDMPDLEVGEIYFMPICVTAPNEWYPYYPGAAMITDCDIDSLSADTNSLDSSSASVEPIMFDIAYTDISTLSDLVGELEALQESNE